MVTMNTEDRSVEPASPAADTAPVGTATQAPQAAPAGQEPAYAAPPSASQAPPLHYPEQLTGSVVDTLV